MYSFTGMNKYMYIYVHIQIMEYSRIYIRVYVGCAICVAGTILFEVLFAQTEDSSNASQKSSF